MKILVTESERRNALAMVRSLSKKGCEVHTAGHLRLSQGFYSRFSGKRSYYPDPAAEPRKFVEALIDRLKGERYDVLLPAHDFTTVPVSKYESELRPLVALAVPEYSMCEYVRDKRNLSTVAEKLGLDIPLTFCPRNQAEVEVAADRLSYPCVLKPRKGFGAKGVRFVTSKDELTACYVGDNPYFGAPSSGGSIFDFSYPIIQEYIPGETHDLCFLYRKGEPRATLTQRRLKTFPGNGGRGILIETTDEPELVRIGKSLLKELRWHGPGQLEFRIDSRDGRPKLIEMNTRFWGSLDLSNQAGMDFPYLTSQMAVEGDISPQNDYRVGTRYRMWFPYELAWAFQSGKLSSLGEFFTIDKESHSAFWLSDPLPHLVEQLYLISSQLSR